MQSTIQENGIQQKTRELCQAIVDQPGFPELKQKVDAFVSDELAVHKFQLLNQKGNLLQMKQSQGMPMVEAEIVEFQKMRDDLMANPIARGFFEAQEEMQKVHETVNKLVSKTFELGRMPTEEDLSEGSCGAGCGCH